MRHIICVRLRLGVMIWQCWIQKLEIGWRAMASFWLPFPNHGVALAVMRSRVIKVTLDSYLLSIVLQPDVAAGKVNERELAILASLALQFISTAGIDSDSSAARVNCPSTPEAEISPRQSVLEGQARNHLLTRR